MDTLGGIAGAIPASFGSSNRKTLSERLGPVIDGLAKSDPGAAKALREKLDRAGRAARTMEDALEAARQGKRDFAKERVKQLREQFGVLHWFAAFDPKVAARLATRMGKALKSAVQDYEDAARADPARTPAEPIEPTVAESERGGAIRQRLGDGVDTGPAMAEPTPEDREFASEASFVRGLIQGLADFARSAGERRDLSTRNALERADKDLRAVDEALRRLLEGSGPPISVLV